MNRRLFVIVAVILSAVPLRAADEVARLHALFDRTWETSLREAPLFATSVGRHEYDDRLPSMTPADIARRLQQAKSALAELDFISRAALPADEIVNYDMFRRQLVDRIESSELGDYEMPFNADSGFHTGFSRLAQEMPMRTVRDYENYIARLNAWPRYVAEEIALMRSGIKRGFTVPRATLEGYDHTISAHVVDDPAKSVFWRPFEKFPSTVPASEHERLRTEGRAAVMNGAVAGYREFLDFFRNEYLPNARKTLAATALPDGQRYYAFKIREFTTLDLTPEQIHEIGLREVDRIGKEQ